jgi:hypothetical protein
MSRWDDICPPHPASRFVHPESRVVAIAELERVELWRELSAAGSLDDAERLLLESSVRAPFERATGLSLNAAHLARVFAYQSRVVLQGVRPKEKEKSELPAVHASVVAAIADALALAAGLDCALRERAQLLAMLHEVYEDQAEPPQEIATAFAGDPAIAAGAKLLVELGSKDRVESWARLCEGVASCPAEIQIVELAVRIEALSSLRSARERVDGARRVWEVAKTLTACEAIREQGRTPAPLTEIAGELCADLLMSASDAEAVEEVAAEVRGMRLARRRENAAVLAPLLRLVRHGDTSR